MNTSLSWIKRYVPDLDVSARTYADAMTLSGTKVETFEELDRNLEKIVVGQVLTCEDHPDSDHLHVCTVDVGDAQPLQIVCGAPNVVAGQKVPVVLAGGRVAGSRDGETKEDGIEIKNGKVRGVESQGMICSIEELGSSHEFYPDAPENGIYVFPEDAVIGSDAVALLGLHDAVIEYEITSNRVDCYSVIGIAREAAATFQKEFHLPEIKETGNAESAADYVKVVVEDEQLCPRFTARVVKNVKIAPSPLWMQRCLASNGIRPINNIVDITNYVMEEYGQPMHAYDYDQIAGHTIVVKRAKDGDVFTTLDGQERKLDSDVLMINDAEKEIGIAGIMGGENSMITDEVQTVLFEAACFDGTNVRLSSKRIGLQTDASQKFDKGLDPATAALAVNRACELMEEFGAGEVVGGMVDVCAGEKEELVLPFVPAEMNALLGTDVSEEEIIRIFERLELKVDTDKKTVTVPTFRQDILRVCDLAEEVARFYGYDKIPTTLPKGTGTAGKLQFDQRVLSVARDVAEACGFSQSYCYSFESPKVFDKLLFAADAPERSAIEIANPLGEDFSVMRTTPLHGILTSLGANYNRRNKEVHLYETANIYLPKALPLTELPEERMQFVMAMYGQEDFFDMKGYVELFLQHIGLHERVSYQKSARPYLHPGRQAEIFYQDVRIGEIGELHPLVAENYEIGERTVIAICDMPAILPFAGFDRKYEGIARFPAVHRDISLLVPHDLTNAQIEEVLLQRGGKILEACELFDLFEGAALGEGKKSMAYSLTFRDATRTLAEEDIAGAMKKIMNGLESIGARLRE